MTTTTRAIRISIVTITIHGTQNDRLKTQDFNAKIGFEKYLPSPEILAKIHPNVAIPRIVTHQPNDGHPPDQQTKKHLNFLVRNSTRR